MGTHPDLSWVRARLEKGKNFDLTDAQYEKKSGIPLPKDTYYLKNRSALAKLVKGMGYSIEVVEKRVIFRKEHGN